MTAETWTCTDCGAVFVPDDDDIDHAILWQATVCPVCHERLCERFDAVMTMVVPEQKGEVICVQL
jgi:hypothetical protein